MTADPGETPAATGAGTVDLTADAKVEAADIPPALVAQSLGQYMRAWLLQIRSGNSGVLPVVLAIVIVAVVFEIITPEHAFLRPSNLVFIFGLSTVYMVLAIAETAVLLLAEVDLSVGAVALIGGVIAFKLVQQPGADWPWWAALLAAFAICGAFGAAQGALVARLRIPSFVVTLAGFLLFSGILIVILGGADSSVNLNTSDPNQNVIYEMVQGLISPVVAWIVLAVLVVAYGATLWMRTTARRRQGLTAPPLSLVAIRIALVAIIGAAVVIICSVNRGSALKSVTGVPWVIPIVLAVLGVWTLVLQRTRFGRYMYAIGGNPEAARRAGVSVPAIRIWAFACARRPPPSAASCSAPSSSVSTAPIRQTPASSSCTRSPPPLSAGSASSAAGARQFTVFSAASSSAASPTACPFSTWVHCPRRWNTSCRAPCSSPRC